MQHVLLAYAPPEDTDRQSADPGGLAAVLDRPDVTGWARLPESARDSWSSSFRRLTREAVRSVFLKDQG